MTVRAATPDDLPDLLRMVADFNAAILPEMTHAPFVARATLSRLITHARGCALVLDRGAGPVGMLLAEAGPSDWDAVLVAQEKVLWIDPAARGSLVDLRALVAAYEAWARSVGVTALQASFIAKSMDAFWQRQGFRPVEQSFLKVLA